MYISNKFYFLFYYFFFINIQYAINSLLFSSVFFKNNNKSRFSSRVVYYRTIHLLLFIWIKFNIINNVKTKIMVNNNIN